MSSPRTLVHVDPVMQALLHRLSGDYYPLHSDPMVAGIAGYIFLSSQLDIYFSGRIVGYLFLATCGLGMGVWSCIIVWYVNLC